MATPRKRRKSTVLGPRDEFRDQLDALKRTKPESDDDGADSRDQADRPLTPRDEYRAALDELNRYSHNNETTEAIEARQRFDRADRNRRSWKWSR